MTKERKDVPIRETVDDVTVALYLPIEILPAHMVVAVLFLFAGESSRNLFHLSRRSFAQCPEGARCDIGFLCAIAFP